MTRAGLRGRLAKLEAKLDAVNVEQIVIWWADVDAGLWREDIKPGGEKEGRTMPLDPVEAEQIKASGEHRVMLTGLPAQRGRK